MLLCLTQRIHRATGQWKPEAELPNIWKHSPPPICSWLHILTTFWTEVFRSVSILTQHAYLNGILLRPFKCDSSTRLWQRERGGEKEKRLILQHPKIHTAIKEHQWTWLINRKCAKSHGDPLCEASHTHRPLSHQCAVLPACSVFPQALKNLQQSLAEH